LRAHGRAPARSTYEWRPCTPPSTWADVVLFSNFSSPEYIMALRGKDTAHVPARAQGTQCPGTCSAGAAATRDTGSSSCNLNGLCCAKSQAEGGNPNLSSPRDHAPAALGRSTRLGPPWWQPGGSPSSLALESTKNRVSTAGRSWPQNPWVPGHSTLLDPSCPEPPAGVCPHAQNPMPHGNLS
uniref:Uncharacterized protein n=1 Tax=Strigops habroptila TaxID=2489341 RepID=A0A672UV07_STRHB